MAVGRITGPLLKANLLRDGVPLAFETDLLYLDVVNGLVGIKTATPTHELTVNGTTRTTNLITTEADIATFNIVGNTISSSDSQITLQPSGANAVVYQGKIVTGDLQISANTIETTATDLDLEINTVGAGEVNINSNVLVNGNLHATGTITADGDIQLGNNLAEDTITFSAEITSNLIPGLDDLTSLPTYTLGSDTNRWNNLYVKDLFAESFTTANFIVNGIDLTLPQGNIIYVATAGDDAASGIHQNDPFLTVKYALSQATAGDTVYIYPGTYTEIFPLTIPVGVTVRGSSLRSVIIQPTVGTVDKDAFLVNGETTIEDLTISGFRYNSGNNTGYGFRFDTNFTVTTRSPYIRNVTVITRGSVTSGSDPYGFDQNDAGKGALVDGSVANVASKEASMLFHSCTFFTPNQETIVATNGVRIEWLNSFTYFADKGLYAYSSAAGFAGAGLTRLRIDNRTGTWNVGNTVTYYDTDGTTVLATGTIASIDGNYFNITGRQLGFVSITDRVGKTVYAQGDAKLSTAQKKFGSASLVLDGVGDYITVSSQPDFAFGTSNFTFEFFWRPTATGVAQVLLDCRTAASDTALYLEMNAAGNIRFYVSGAYRITSSVACTAGTFNHIALFRVGGVTKLAVNGTLTPTTWSDSTNYPERPVRMGASWTGGALSTGYIDEVRVVKGVAKYTTSVTVPTTPLTGDLDTVLLLHFNGLNNSITFLDDGITNQDVRTSAGGTASLINFADYSDFGAEIRAIGSANVYGTYGAYGDGPGVIAYLISQNFAYIGAGKLTTNDPNDRIAANEVVELNGAKIYYTSVDNEGNFKVGDSFYVNQKTGEVLFNSQTINITSSSGVTFTDGTNTTTITPTNIDTGNIRISGNTVESISGNLNITAANGTINLQNNTFITGDLDVTGDITLGGNIQIGDANTDTINFVGGINSNLVPATNNFYNLGSSVDDLWWKNIYLNRAEIDGVVIDNNQIATTVGNDDLTLVANGTGRIYIPSSDVQIDQNLNVDGTLYAGTFDVTNTLTANIFTTGDIEINDNYITTTLTASDLILSANGAGRVYVTGTDVEIAQTLTVTGLTTLDDLDINGNVVQFGDVEQTGNVIQTGTYHLTGELTVDGQIAQFQDIKLDANLLTTTATDSDLIIVANGIGKVYIPSNDVQIDQNLNVIGTLTAGSIEVTNTLTSNIFTTGDIEINDNYITTTLPSSDLELKANGTGKITVPSNDVTITQQLSVTGLTTLGNVDINGNVVQFGDVTQTGNVIQTGTYHLTGELTVDGQIAQFQDIKLDANLLTTTATNSDLIIVANGTGKVYIPSNDVQIDQNLTVLGTLDAGTINVTNTLTSNIFTTGDIEINDNYITTTLPSSNLELKANGTGKITVPSNDVAITQQLGVTGLTTLGNVDINGNIVQYGDVTQTGNVIQTGTYNLTGELTVDGQVTQFANIKLDDNLITTTVTNSNLDLVANGTGKIYVPSNNVQIDQSLTVTQDLTVTTGTTNLKNTSVTGTITQTGDINQTGNFTTSGNTEVTGNITATGYLDLPSINITGTTITTKVAGTDLNLVANGTGNVVIEGIKISDNNIQSVVADSNITLTPQGTGSVVVNSNQSLILPIGDNSQRPLTPTNGMIRYNNQIGRYEGYNGSYWLPMSGVQDVDGNTYITAEATPGANDNTLRFYADNSLMVTIDSTKLFAERLQTTALDIQNNTITTIVNDTDINLSTPGTGGVKVGNLRVRNNTITNTSAGAVTEFLQTGSGYVKIAGTNGVVIPAGDTEFDRPVVPERGMIRYNTVLQLVEIYTGVTWTSVAGTSSGISEAQATDIGILTALLFG